MSNLKQLQGIDDLERKLQKIEAMLMSGQVILGWRSLCGVIAELKAAKEEIYNERTETATTVKE